MSQTTKRLTVDQYDQMVEDGILPQTNRLELIEGRIVEKARQSPPQAFSSESCRDALASLVPASWHVRCGNPVRVPARDSEPEPDVSVVRGQIRDYCDHHPGPEDVALVVEVVRWDVTVARVQEKQAFPAPGRRIAEVIPLHRLSWPTDQQETGKHSWPGAVNTCR